MVKMTKSMTMSMVIIGKETLPLTWRLMAMFLMPASSADKILIFLGIYCYIIFKLAATPLEASSGT